MLCESFLFYDDDQITIFRNNFFVFLEQHLFYLFSWSRAVKSERLLLDFLITNKILRQDHLDFQSALALGNKKFEDDKTFPVCVLYHFRKRF